MEWLKGIAVVGAVFAMLGGLWLVFSRLNAKNQGFGPNSLRAIGIVLFVPSILILVRPKPWQHYSARLRDMCYLCPSQTTAKGSVIISSKYDAGCEAIAVHDQEAITLQYLALRGTVARIRVPRPLRYLSQNKASREYLRSLDSDALPGRVAIPRFEPSNLAIATQPQSLCPLIATDRPR